MALCLLFLLLALVVSGFGWRLPLIEKGERALYDLRAFVAAPTARDQDSRIVIFVYDEDTLSLTGRRSPLDRGLMAQALARLDAMGPRAIGIDVLIDQAQPEDAALARTLRALRTPTRLASVSRGAYPDLIQPWQAAYMDRFFGGLTGSQVRPGSVVLATDGDNVVREWPVLAPGDAPALSSGLISPATEGRFPGGPISFRRWPYDDGQGPFVTLPIQMLLDRDQAAVVAGLVKGRYVLLGSAIPDLDEVPVPGTLVTGKTMKGVELHATLLAQALDGVRYRPLPPWLPFALAALVVLSAAATAAFDLSAVRLGLAVSIAAGAVLGLPVALHAWHWDSRSISAFGWILGWLLAYFATSAAARSVGAQQRRLAQGALGRYLPADIAALIQREPSRMELHGEACEIFVVFSDLEGFTELTHRLAPEQVADLLNRYLDSLSEVVLSHGGTLDKFVGDAVVAFWGAPISRPDDADRAAAAAAAIHLAGEALRRSVPDINMGRTRVGLHHGTAVVGNFGGQSRLQYTALGDAMNTAARLEGANKSLRTRVLISQEALRDEASETVRAMGRVTLRGRETPVVVWEAASDFPPDARLALNAAWARFDGGDTSATRQIAALVRRFPDDEALANLLQRLRDVGPGGSYRLS